ncbi:MAG: dihydroorotase [Deinococcales bacterium]
MKIEIQNARLPDNTTKTLYIENGVIVANLSSAPDTVINAQNYLLSPALIDPHAHLRVPGQLEKENLETGLGAAVAGGFGSVVCMPNTNPALEQPELLRSLQDQANQLGLARLYSSAALTRGRAGQILTDAAALQRAGAVMLTDDGNTNEDAGVLRRGLEYAHALGLLVSVHAEDASLRGNGVMNEGKSSALLGLPGNPIAAEAARIARDLEICALTGARLHIQHLSSARGLELVRAAKARGIRVSCEVAPHHLTLTDTLLTTERFYCDPVLKVAPPLRSAADCAALLEGLIDGTVDCIGTDHAPHTAAEKQLDMLSAPFGIANIEITFPLLYTRFVETGKLELSKLLELMTTGVAKVLGWQVPNLEVGSVADVALFDLHTSKTVDSRQFKSKARFDSPWQSETLRGWAVCTIVHGQVVFDARP